MILHTNLDLTDFFPHFYDFLHFCLFFRPQIYIFWNFADKISNKKEFCQRRLLTATHQSAHALRRAEGLAHATYWRQGSLMLRIGGRAYTPANQRCTLSVKWALGASLICYTILQYWNARLLLLNFAYWFRILILHICTIKTSSFLYAYMPSIQKLLQLIRVKR